jgi:class I fructose-bisphosphate aldolase
MAKQSSPQKSLLDVVSPGKKARLVDMLYNHGPGNGTLMFLPIDQGIEHGPRDFFPNPASKDPDYQFALAAGAAYSGIACQIGFANKYWPDWAGQVPLLLKINGKTDIPSSADAFSACNASVEDGVRLGATAIGYTMYVGSPRQDEDLKQLGEVRADCEKYGMPLVVWSYPRGSAIDAKGGANGFYAIDYAARMAMEQGADIVKINMPKVDLEADADAPAPYNKLKVDQQEAIRQCVDSAGRSLVVLSGGSKISDAQVLEQTRLVMKAGGSGVIYGRNIWQRKPAAAKKMVTQISDALVKSVIRKP